MVTFVNSHGDTVKGKSVPTAVRSRYGRNATVRKGPQVGRKTEYLVIRNSTLVDRIYV